MSSVKQSTTLWSHRQNDAVPQPPENSTAWWMMSQTQNDVADPSSHHHHHLHHHHHIETLFEKSLTPSDVGKLNRLVIPKQQAEKYFPLNGSSAEKGTLLSFEDETGKCWIFRYSYWSSSQSYVLTKGWSRYVKDKHLFAGDFVFFQRHLSDHRRFFIRWRRRGGVASSTTPYRQLHHQLHLHGSSYPHCSEVEEAESSAMGPSSRTVRLFGVNLECNIHHGGDDVAASAEPQCRDG